MFALYNYISQTCQGHRSKQYRRIGKDMRGNANLHALWLPLEIWMEMVVALKDTLVGRRFERRAWAMKEGNILGKGRLHNIAYLVGVHLKFPHDFDGNFPPLA